MNLTYKNLTIRDAGSSDAAQLCKWWNNGDVMAHAGFPNGLDTTLEIICESLASDTDETHRRHIIELDGNPIGEMNYRNVTALQAAASSGKSAATAEIGIKICEVSEQEKGYGTTLLNMFIGALFTHYGYEKIILDTNTDNKRAQHVYKNKLHFSEVGVRGNSWTNQLGELQSSIDYELTRENWLSAV